MRRYPIAMFHASFWAVERLTAFWSNGKAIRMVVVISSLLGGFFHNQQARADNRLMWQRVLNDTVHKTSADLKSHSFIGPCLDSLGYIYFIDASGGADSAGAELVKVSPDGDVLFRIPVLPDSLNWRALFSYRTQEHLFFDQQNHLVLAAVALDMLPDPHVMVVLSKWDHNGTLLDQKVDFLIAGTDSIGYKNHVAPLTVSQEGNLSFVLYDTDNFLAEMLILGYDPNFNRIFTKWYPFGSVPNPAYYPVALVTDSAVYFVHTTTGGMNTINLLRLQQNTGDTLWYQQVQTNTYAPAPLFLSIHWGNLFLTCNRIFKIDTATGSILAEDSLYNPDVAVFDDLNGKIFTCSSYQPGEQKLVIFDTALSVQAVIQLDYVPTGLILGDSLFMVYGVDSNELFVLPEYNKFSITRFDYQLNALDNNVVTLPEVFQRMQGNPGAAGVPEEHITILADAVGGRQLPGNIAVWTNPIVAQKVCYGCLPDLEGQVFIDLNNDCVPDSSDWPVVNHPVRMMPYDLYTLTDETGHYGFFRDTGWASVHFIPRFVGVYPCGDSVHTVNVNAVPADSLHFGLTSELQGRDLSLELLASPARYLGIQNIWITIENHRPVLDTQSLVHFRLDSNFYLWTTSVPPDSVNGNDLFWTIDSLWPGQLRTITVQAIAWEDPGSPYIHWASVSGLADQVVQNNTDTLSGNVVGPFDPNYKDAYPRGETSRHYIESGTEINYYVEFQNVGTDTAFLVRILDELDPQLDLSTFKFKGATHPCKVSLSGQLLKFTFEQIQLPDSNKDYHASIGSVAYSIKTKTLPDGCRIRNSAAIYFDYNAPVITNEVFHTIGRVGSYFSQQHRSDFNLFPNPSDREQVQVVAQVPDSDWYQITVSDLSGRILERLTANAPLNGKHYHRLNCGSRLDAGAYTVTLQTRFDLISKLWLVIH